MKPKEDKKFTWADLKRRANRIPKERLQDEVVIWTDDEKAYRVSDVERLTEDYLFDGDEGCAPKSAMKDCIEDAKQTGDEDEYYLIHPKGRRILYAS